MAASGVGTLFVMDRSLRRVRECEGIFSILATGISRFIVDGGIVGRQDRNTRRMVDAG